jgi:hypothetical protein
MCTVPKALSMKLPEHMIAFYDSDSSAAPACPCPAESGQVRVTTANWKEVVRNHAPALVSSDNDEGVRWANAQVRGPFRLVAGAGFEPA